MQRSQTRSDIAMLHDWLQHYAGFCFDFDGVVVQSEPIKFEAYRHAYKTQLSIDIEDMGYVWSGKSEREVVAFFNHAYQLNISEDDPVVDAIIHSKRETYELHIHTQMIPLIRGLETFLQHLQQHHKPICLVTSSRRLEVSSILSFHNICDAFTAMITAENVSRKKPDPQPYRKALKALGMPASAVLVFEDSACGASAALAAGLSFVLVNSTVRDISVRSQAIRCIDHFSEALSQSDM